MGELLALPCAAERHLRNELHSRAAIIQMQRGCVKQQIARMAHAGGVAIPHCDLHVKHLLFTAIFQWSVAFSAPDPRAPVFVCNCFAHSVSYLTHRAFRRSRHKLQH